MSGSRDPDTGPAGLITGSARPPGRLSVLEESSLRAVGDCEAYIRGHHPWLAWAVTVVGRAYRLGPEACADVLAQLYEVLFARWCWDLLEVGEHARNGYAYRVMVRKIEDRRRWSRDGAPGPPGGDGLPRAAGADVDAAREVLLEVLTGPERDAVVLVHGLGKDEVQVAEELGLSARAVSRLLERAVTALRDHLPVSGVAGGAVGSVAEVDERVRGGDARLDAALSGVFSVVTDTPGGSGTDVAVEGLLLRAKGIAGLSDLQPRPVVRGRPVEARRGVLASSGLLALSVVVVAGGIAWHRLEVVAAARQRAVAFASDAVRGPFTSAEVNQLASRVIPSIVDVDTDLGPDLGGAGTGIVLGRSSEVLTNNHVINGAYSVEVVAKGDGRRYAAEVVGYDRDHDVALLRILNPGRLTPAVLGDSSSVRVGAPIVGIGNAGGAGGEPARAPGKVAELGAWISTGDELTGSTEQLRGLIRVVADIRPGDSGGPLVNEAGEVVAVNTAASVNYVTNVPDGIGYAIPINDAMAVVGVIRGGRSTEEVHVGPTGVLGVQVTGPDVYPDGRIAAWATPGVKVTSVVPRSPADKAGLRVGDTIVGLDGRTIDTSARLTAVIGAHQPGDRLALAWVDSAGRHRGGVVVLDGGPPA